jgi:crotonobetainyl-CoA:carnitine CoA-transferase CaiB-like acyl-CoA transferase
MPLQDLQALSLVRFVVGLTAATMLDDRSADVIEIDLPGDGTSQR